MRIIYADDAPTMLRSVVTYFREQGQEIIGLETDNLLRFQEQLTEVLESGFAPDVLIIGGHNLLRNQKDEPMLDVNAFSIYGWLNGMEKLPLWHDCPTVLFSRDEAMRQDALNHPEWGIRVVVAKDAPEALPTLAEAVQTLARHE